MSKKKILMVAGGMGSQYLFDTGIFYSASIEESKFKNYILEYSVIYVDGKIGFPKTLQKKDYEEAKKYDIFEAGQLIKKMDIDCIFYLPSSWVALTDYRLIFEKLGFPIAGPSAECQFLSFNKILTRSKLGSSKVILPPGCSIKYEDKDNLNKILEKFKEKNFTFPVIVKSPCEDDSQGLHVVREEKDLLPAINDSFSYQYKKEILIEKFIPGREIRTAVIEDENQNLVFLPVCEYGIDPNKIRENKHKIYEFRSKEGLDIEMIERKILDPQVDADFYQRLKEISFESFKTLNINDWAVFDYRYNTEEDKFYFIEAGLFCHFSPSCNIGKLANDIGITQEQHIDITFNNAIRRFNSNKLN